jgi:hypothetical protein
MRDLVPSPLAGDQITEPTHSRDIAARPVEAGDIALPDRVATSRKHNRAGGRRHGSQYRTAASRRGDHGRLAADQVGRKGRQSIVLVFSNGDASPWFDVVDRR